MTEIKYLDWFRGFLFLLLTLVPSKSGFSAETKRAEDLAITVESNWSGGLWGGYHPIRIQVVNRGETRELEFQFEPSYYRSRFEQDNPTYKVVKKITVEQNATAQITMNIPVLQEVSGEVRTSINGRNSDDLRFRIRNDYPSYGLITLPSVLSISTTPRDTNSIVLLEAEFGGTGLEQYFWITPLHLPETWISYSSVDIVVIPYTDFVSIPNLSRQAILRWMETGGLLIVDGVGENRDKLGQLIGHGDWVDYPFANDPVEASAWNVDVWEQKILLGQLIALKGDAYPGTLTNWKAIYFSVGENPVASTPRLFPRRYGSSGRFSQPDFQSFRVPGVGRIPIVSLLFMITTFSIVIGPLNYWFAARRRRMYLLLFTIPTLAFITSCLLFGYSTLVDGFSTRSRTLSLTVVDQELNRAVSMARVGLYSGMAPSDGMRFRGETCYLPLYSRERGTGDVDLSDNDQHFTGGWLRSRTMTQHVIIENREERGRVDLRREGNAFSLSNGFEWDFRYLVIKTGQGEYFWGESIPAGSEAVLDSRVHSTVEIQELIRNTRPSNKGGSSSYYQYNDFDSFQEESSVSQQISFENSFLMRYLNLFDSKLRGAELDVPIGTYFAILESNDQIDIGVTKHSDVSSLHLLKGKVAVPE